jgi:hypothetical protein
MLIARLIVGLMLAAGVVCFAAFIATGQPRFRTLGVLLVKWTVIAGLAFFAVLIVERLATLL